MIKVFNNSLSFSFLARLLHRELFLGGAGFQRTGLSALNPKTIASSQMAGLCGCLGLAGFFWLPWCHTGSSEMWGKLSFDVILLLLLLLVFLTTGCAHFPHWVLGWCPRPPSWCLPLYFTMLVRWYTIPDSRRREVNYNKIKMPSCLYLLIMKKGS